jgi:hypothetical protein
MSPSTRGLVLVLLIEMKLMKLLFKLGVPLVIIGLAILSHANVWGADWRLYAKTDLYECFYNAEDMIRSSEDIVKVWAKLVYTERGVIEMVKEFGKHYENLTYSLELWEINCAGKKHRLLSITAYSVEGNILYTNQTGVAPPPWKIISRESVGESLYKAVCK